MTNSQHEISQRAFMEKLARASKAQAQLMHPWYGECDALTELGGCAECEKVMNRLRANDGGVPDIEPLDHFEIRGAVRKYRAGSPSQALRVSFERGEFGDDALTRGLLWAMQVSDHEGVAVALLLLRLSAPERYAVCFRSEPSVDLSGDPGRDRRFWAHACEASGIGDVVLRFSECSSETTGTKSMPI